MTSELMALIEAGRGLPLEDRYELAHQMLISADGEVESDPNTVGAAWRAEFHRRIDDIDSGAVQLVDGADTMRIARERIARRRVERAA